MTDAKIFNSDGVKIYEPIPDTKNIITTLVNKLNVDKTFQMHVKKLQDSAELKSQKKAHAINTTIENIRVFNTNGEPIFLAKDIGILMGISQINYLIRKFEPEEKMEGYIIKNNKTKKVVFLTRHGIYRCFFASRSPLAKLFRKFICNLVDHIVEHESEILEKFSEKFQLENDELIERGLNDLREKLDEYEAKYLEEKKKSALLEEQVMDEKNKRSEIVAELHEVDIINTYNMMHIQQLKKDKSEYINKLKNINDNVLAERSESIDAIELRIMKEKFMKPMYVYILHPEYLNKLLISKKNELVLLGKQSNDPDDLNYDTDDDDRKISPKDDQLIGKIDDLLDDDTYSKNFQNIFTKDTMCIEPDEILYMSFGFSRKTEKKNKTFIVDTKWVINKKHFTNVINSISQDSSILHLNNHDLYKTSLDEINEIVREEFVIL